MPHPAHRGGLAGAGARDGITAASARPLAARRPLPREAAEAMSGPDPTDPDATAADPVLAVLPVAAGRRWVAVAMLLVLGGLLVWTALARPPAAPGWRVLLLAAGLAALWLSVRLRAATTRHLELTATALRDSAGVELARVAEIAAVDRGPFAFKPSGGFVLRLSADRGAAWAPGLWWRVGRRLGVGGVTGRTEARYMAEVVVALLAERRGGVVRRAGD